MICTSMCIYIYIYRYVTYIWKDMWNLLYGQQTDILDTPIPLADALDPTSQICSIRASKGPSLVT